MTHQHLRLQLLDRVKRNTNHDDDRGAAERNVGQRRGNRTYDQRQDRNNTEENRTDKGALAERLGNKVAGRLARTEARNKAAVLLQVIGDLNRVKLDGRIEIRKRQNEQAINHDIEGVGLREQVQDVIADRTGLRLPEHCDSLRQGED